jgi:hypothetical protein
VKAAGGLTLNVGLWIKREEIRPWASPSSHLFIHLHHRCHLGIGDSLYCRRSRVSCLLCTLLFRERQSGLQTPNTTSFNAANRLASRKPSSSEIQFFVRRLRGCIPCRNGVDCHCSSPNDVLFKYQTFVAKCCPNEARLIC